MLRGDYEQSARHFQDMAALAREGERPWDLAAALRGLGAAKEKQAEYQQAAALFAESLAILHKFRNKPRVALCLGHLAEVYGRQGQWRRAARLFAAAEVLRQAVSSSLTPDQW